MNQPKSSFIVSPNLGCPEIVSLEGINQGGFRVVLAVPVSEVFDAAAHKLSASLSFGDRQHGFALAITDPRKLEDEALPARFEDVSETRSLISTTLRTELLPGHAFWEVWAKPATAIDDKDLRSVKGTPRSTLYDLSLKVHDTVVGRVKHALCLRVDDPTAKFVHLTDLHVAARNDMWEAEVHAVIEGSPVTPGPQEFKNFNRCLREFIRWANQEADEGRLDFVLALGDLVDFSRTGLFDRTPDDSNWSTLIEILTGSPAEDQRNNEGLRVPVFAATGNHDWRTYPYSPRFRLNLFGITKECADELDFWYRNTSVDIGKKLEDVNQKLMRKGSPLLARSWWSAVINMGLRGFSVGLRRLAQRGKAIGVSWGRQLLWALLGAWFGVKSISETKGLSLSELGQRFLQWFHHPAWPPHLVLWLVVLACALFVSLVAPSRLYAWLRTTLEGLIAIEAEVSTISEYFLRVNPYFNYAFQLGNCYFIVLDTGPDCLTAQSFWDDGGKKVRRVSIKDNILGGSPDTMGFYPANEYYPYSQITWLENVLSCIGEREARNAGERQKHRIFVGLHAPPANLSVPKRKQADDQLQLNQQRNQPYVFMKEGGPLDGYDIRYGTVNHYLSQFFYLCLGYREGEQSKFIGPGIDAVFAGHAHWTMEFQLRRPKDAGPKWSPELLYGNFSERVEATCHSNVPWGPLLLQTAACGPAGDIAKEVPPNFRYVTVDGNGEVCNLRPCTLPPQFRVAKAASGVAAPAPSSPMNKQP